MRAVTVPGFLGKFRDFGADGATGPLGHWATAPLMPLTGAEAADGSRDGDGVPSVLRCPQPSMMGYSRVLSRMTRFTFGFGPKYSTRPSGSFFTFK